MEPLENRIARLTPEQQQEVGDFVDFLLLRNNIRQPPAASQPALIMVNTPPVMVPDPGSPLAPLPVPASVPTLVPASDVPAPVIPAEESPSAIHEITAGGEDWITREYMDYGRFDDTSSPATEAVKKVRQKIAGGEEKDKPGHILDWVD